MNNRLMKMIAGVIALAAMTVFATPAWTQEPGAASTGAAYLTANGQSSYSGDFSGGNGIPVAYNTTTVPEPSSWALFGAGLAMVGFIRFISYKRRSS